MNTNKKEESTPRDMGKLLYSVTDEWTQCCKSFHVQLHFYEHLVVIRTSENPTCGDFSEQYTSFAIPRFKIINVTFTNGGRNGWRRSLLFFFIALIAFGLAQAVIMGLIFVAIGVVFLFLTSKNRNVTFDLRGPVQGVSSSLFGTTGDSSVAVEFGGEVEPDETFIMNYVYDSLRLGSETSHLVSHWNGAALATPIAVSMNDSLVRGMRSPRCTSGSNAHSNTIHKQSGQIDHAGTAESTRETDWSQHLSNFDGYDVAPGCADPNDAESGNPAPLPDDTAMAPTMSEIQSAGYQDGGSPL